MKFWVAEHPCGCVVDVCPDTGSILPVGAPNNEFVRQAVARGLKTWLSETGVSIGPCPQHRQFGPVEGTGATNGGEVGGETGKGLEATAMKEERLETKREMPAPIRVTMAYWRDGELLVDVSGDEVRVYDMTFTSKSEAAIMLRALADWLDGVKRHGQRKGKGNV